MRKKLLLILTILFSVAMIAACGAKEKPEITFNNGNEVTISVIQSHTAGITVSTEDGVPAWTVKEGEEVVAVNPTSDGMQATIVGLKNGTAVVEVKTEHAQATLQVVVEKSAELALLEVEREEIALLTGGTYSVNPTLTFKETALDATYQFSTRNEAVAQVDANGNITAAGLGETVIDVVCSYYGFTFEKEIAVIVQPKIEVFASAKEINVYKKTDGSPYVSSQDLTVRVVADGTEVLAENVQATSVDCEIAVIEGGKVVGLNVGQTKIEIKFTVAEKEYKDYIFVNVKDLPQVEVRFAKEKIMMYEYFREQEISTQVIVDGEVVEDATVNYSSENESVAKIDGSKVKAVANGNAVIKAVYNDGVKDYYGQANVQVKNSISLASEALGADKNGVIAEIKADSALTFETEIDLTNATKANSLIKFHILSQNEKESGKADVEYLYVKLTDTENSENYITFKINKALNSATKCCIKAASNGNGHYGWRNGYSQSGWLASEKPSGVHGEMGTNYTYGFFSNESNLDQAINLSYDNAEKSAYAIKGTDDYALIFNLGSSDANVGASTYKGFTFFEGFTNGKAKLSVYADGYADNVDMVRIYVEEVNGVAADSFGLDKIVMR